VRLAQTAPRLGDLQTNLRDHLQAIEDAVGDGIDLLVFPELSLTGYYLRDLTSDVALTPSSPELAELATATTRTSMVVGLV